MKPLPLSHSSLRKLNVLAVFSLCLSASFFVLQRLDYPLIGIDDANIYFVYARNLASGHGFVYNIGGERVEGFTSLLWTFISALAFKVSAYPELTLLIINIVVLSLGIFYALNYLQKPSLKKDNEEKPELFWSILFLILIFSSPRYMVWNTVTLMENALWSTLLLLTTIFVIQNHPSSRAINLGFISFAILLLLTRPESMLWVAVFAAVLFLRMAAAGNPAAALKSLWPSLAGIALTLGLLVLFRLWYFGYPFPNTYYAKVSPSLAYNLEQGTLYLIRYIISDPIAAVCVFVVFFSCIVSLRSPYWKDASFFLPFLAAIGLLTPLITGGDHFGSYRFYQNIYPISILALIDFFQRILPQLTANLKFPKLSGPVRTALFTALVLALVPGFVLSQIHAWSVFSSDIKVEFDVAKYERRSGAFIEDLFSTLPRPPSIGVIASGGIKYSYTGEIIDLLGLNNTVMAHNRGSRIGHKDHAAFERQTFYQLQPDIVWPIYVEENKWEYSETGLQKGWANTLGFRGLFDDPHFLERYQYSMVGKSGSQNGYALVAWFRKDFLKKLIADPGFHVVEYEYSP